MTSKKSCFVVSQIGDEDSAERIHADWFLEAIVEPVFESRSDFSVERADKLSHPGLIDAQVIQKLLTAELVVADLTGLNPNVFYEIGIRHMAQKPINHMHEVGQRIPFDVSLYRSISYSRIRPKDLTAARGQLEKMVEHALAADYQVENPVTNARGRFSLEQHATPEQQVLIDQIRGVEQRLANLELDARSESDALPVYAAVTPPRRIRTLPVDARVSTFHLGDRVTHLKFGTGTVVGIEGAKLTVEFERGTKRVVDSFVHRTDD
jgi:hypothetical protein